MTDIVKAALTAVAIVATGLAFAFTNFVSSAEWDDHLTAEERRYVLQLKADLRDIAKDITADPGNQGLLDDREELIDELCELRPDDRLCR